MAKKIILIFCCAAFMFLTSTEASGSVTRFFADLENAVSKMNTYQVIKESENWKGKKHEKKASMFRFKKPNLMRTDVLEGKKKGNSVVLNKEGVIRGRHRIGFKKTLKPTDKKLRSIRGYTFMNSSLSDKVRRLKEHVLEKGCKGTLTEEKYMNKPSYHLHIDHLDHSDTEDPSTSEDAWFDKKTYVILKNLKYENEKKVTDITYRDFEINIPLDDALFEQ